MLTAGYIRGVFRSGAEAVLAGDQVARFARCRALHINAHGYPWVIVAHVCAAPGWLAGQECRLVTLSATHKLARLRNTPYYVGLCLRRNHEV